MTVFVLSATAAACADDKADDNVNGDVDVAVDGAAVEVAVDVDVVAEDVDEDVVATAADVADAAVVVGAAEDVSLPSRDMIEERPRRKMEADIPHVRASHMNVAAQSDSTLQSAPCHIIPS